MSRLLGQLSNRDIARERRKANGLRIQKFVPSHLKAASYDITPSIIAMSSRTGMLETVYRENAYPFHHYIIVSAKDSILVVSNEYIHVPKYIAGHVVSRVSKVAEGFGHISTSIDPGWSGAALIALSNPSNKPLKVRVGTSLHDTTPENSLATLIFYYLSSPADLGAVDKYPGMRLDLLEKLCYKNRQGLRSWWQRCIHPFRRRFTDFFFAYYETHSKKLNLNSWASFIDAFSGRPGTPGPAKQATPNDVKGKKKYPWDFIVQENPWTRLLFWYKRHKLFLHWIAILIFILLVLFGIIPEEVSSIVANLWAGGM